MEEEEQAPTDTFITGGDMGTRECSVLSSVQWPGMEIQTTWSDWASLCWAQSLLEALIEY